MKANKLQNGYDEFGNRGALSSNEIHIAKAYETKTLCGIKMKATNWEAIESKEEIGCPECLAIYGKPNTDEWNLMMNAAKQYIGTPVIIPGRFAEYMIDHFTNCLPPIVWGSDYVLCSEPYDWEPETDSDRYIGFFTQDNIPYAVITTVEKFKSLRRL